jgi:cytochrome c peroxidase
MMQLTHGTSILAALIVLGSIGADVAHTQTAPTIAQALKDQYRRAPARPVENATLVELGLGLFTDPQLSASGKTACITCHLPQAAWSVLEARSTNDSGKLTSRKSQTLIGIGHAASPINGWDGRNPTLEAQAKSSVTTGSMSMRETPTPVAVEVIEQRFRSNPAYVAKFNAALPGAPVNIDTIVQAVAAFERTIEPEQAPFDRWIAGDEAAISASAKRGFELFNSKGLCFTCHGGWRFTDDKFHDIGTSTTDRGRGVTLKDDPQMQFAFKTPTLRSVAQRSPYMNNGSAATLDDVVRHYEKGGIDRPSRSPLLQPIKLNDQERRDLVAFMETLGPAAATR